MKKFPCVFESGFVEEAERGKKGRGKEGGEREKEKEECLCRGVFPLAILDRLEESCGFKLGKLDFSVPSPSSSSSSSASPMIISLSSLVIQRCLATLPKNEEGVERDMEEEFLDFFEKVKFLTDDLTSLFPRSKVTLLFPFFLPLFSFLSPSLFHIPLLFYPPF